MPKTDVSTPTTGAWLDEEARELVVERTFNAPRELVFNAFTDREQLAKWWGPRDWPTTIKHMDVRPGGYWHYCMTGPDGTQSWGKGIFVEIAPPEKLVWTNVFSDADANTNEGLPESQITFVFTDLGDGKTKLSAIASYDSAEALQSVVEMGMVGGLSESLDKLEKQLAA